MSAVRVLFSFPLRLGADRICGIAWQQVNGLAAAGADVLGFPASISRPVRPDVRVSPTLARGEIPPAVQYRGHDARRVRGMIGLWPRRIEKLAGAD